MRPVIFLGGIPGSGKTTAAALIRQRRPEVTVANAGELIRRGLGHASANARIVVQDGDDARNLQEVLIVEAAQLRAVATTDVVIDGHFVVPTAGGPAPVPAEVFDRLGCRLLVQIRVEPQVVARRLKVRGGTPWWNDSISQIVELDASERTYAEAVAETIQVPLIVARDGAAAADAILMAMQM